MLDLRRPPMTRSARDVAAEFHRRLGDDLDPAHLHRLLYYARGWHLAWRGEALFPEAVVATPDGPRIPGLDADDIPPPPERIDSGLWAIVDLVLSRHRIGPDGRLTGKLRDDLPWMQARDGAHPDDEPELAMAAVAEWFATDPWFTRHQREVEALRARRDIYSFDAVGLPPAAEPIDWAARSTPAGHDRQE